MTFTQLFNQRVFAGLQPIIEIATTGLWFSIYWLGAALLIPMDLTGRIQFFGDIVAFAMYANYILSAFMMMVMIFMMLPPAMASGERIMAVLDSKVRITEGKVNTKDDSKNLIEFKDVYFKYPKTETKQIL